MKRFTRFFHEMFNQKKDADRIKHDDKDHSISAGPGETNSQKLEDGRTATVSVEKDGSKATIDIE